MHAGANSRECIETEKRTDHADKRYCLKVTTWSFLIREKVDAFSLYFQRLSLFFSLFILSFHSSFLLFVTPRNFGEILPLPRPSGKSILRRATRDRLCDLE